jgi:hypothetical protein
VSQAFASLPQRDFADLVLHVLAHVESTKSLPSSLYDPVYVELCRRELGAAEDRQLGADALALGPLLSRHETLASVQRLAWLHETIGESMAQETKSLAELRPDDVARPALLSAFAVDEVPLVELLRSAVALERPHHARLAPVEVAAGEQEELLHVVTELCAVAPGLSRARIAFVRSLGRRGRVWGKEIWLGIPGSENGPTPEYAAWQAAHEATVVEVAEAAANAKLGLTEREIESAGLVVLSARARGEGISERHRSWFADVSGGAAAHAVLEGARDEVRTVLRRFGVER